MALLANQDLDIYSKWQKKMFLREEFSDCTIWVKTSMSCTRFPCHRANLVSSSEVFAEILRTTTHEKCSSIIIEDLNPNAVIVILKYIYFGHTELKGYRLVCDVLKAAVKYKMLPLIHHCEDYLEEKLTLQNVYHILETAILNNSLNLKEICKALCREAGFVILNTSSFQEVNLETLKMILSITDLQIQSEMVAFKASWEWATYQCCKEAILVSDENIVNKMSPLLEFIVFEFMSSEEIDSLPTAALDKFHEMFPQRTLGSKNKTFDDGCNSKQYERSITDTTEFGECAETSHCLSFHLIKQRKVIFPLQLTNYCKNFKAPVFLYQDILLKGNIILFRFAVNTDVYLKDLSIIHYSKDRYRKTPESLHIYNKNGILASFSIRKGGNIKMIVKDNSYRVENNLYPGETFTFHALDLLLVKAQKEYTVEVNRSSGECNMTWPGTLMEKMRVDDVEVSILSQRCYGLCNISFIEAS